MKKMRAVLCSLLVGVSCSAVFVAHAVNASTTTAYLAARTTKPGYYTTWNPSSNSSGWVLHNGGQQTIKFDLTTAGNLITAGFYQTSTGILNPWYYGTMSGKSTGPVTLNMPCATGYYKPYISNENDTVYIYNVNTSYAKMQ